MGILKKIGFHQQKEKVYVFFNRVPRTPKILGLLRVRNEELILEDTLNHLSKFCDGIVCYEDDSDDKTFAILKKHKSVIAIIRNFTWLSQPAERIKCETTHRLALLNLAKTFAPEWVFCADADERYIGDIRQFIESNESRDVDLVRISLFDAYITIEDNKPFNQNQTLLNFRKYYGPERRDIVMLWRVGDEEITFIGEDSREPAYPINKKVINKFYCQHYGKSLSINHWEETCNYYIKYFPYETYGAKWEKRRGKAIHTLSDFGSELYEWGEGLFNKAIKIHPS